MHTNEIVGYKSKYQGFYIFTVYNVMWIIIKRAMPFGFWKKSSKFYENQIYDVC